MGHEAFYRYRQMDDEISILIILMVTHLLRNRKQRKLVYTSLPLPRKVHQMMLGTISVKHPALFTKDLQSHLTHSPMRP